MELKIEKGIPIPVAANKWATVLRQMEVSDSVVVNSGHQRNALVMAAKAQKMKLVTRAEGESIRVWRVA